MPLDERACLAAFRRLARLPTGQARQKAIAKEVEALVDNHIITDANLHEFERWVDALRLYRTQ